MKKPLKQAIGIFLGMCAAVVLWQAIAAFIGLSFIVNGIQAGVSLIIFSAGIFIAAGIAIKPKKDD